MNVGMIGLGKLGLPVAQAMQRDGHKVAGWDINPDVRDTVSDIRLATPEKIVEGADLIFVAVQTPHEPEFDGTHPLPEHRANFNYDYLTDALDDLNKHASTLTAPIVVISTCLPGTMKNISYLFGDDLNLIYNPMFVSMGNVIRDYQYPEFILIGTNPESDRPMRLRDFYELTHSRSPIIETDYTTAEAIKVSYNTFITAKTVLANTWGQICDKLNINVDDLYEAWKLARQRLISPQYLQAGMSDGGPCHPRDNIALSWLSNELGLNHNYFDGLMEARQAHEEYLADLIEQAASKENFVHVVVFGKAFKPGTTIEEGSPGVLLANLLRERGLSVEHRENPEPGKYNIVATKHGSYRDIQWPKGSTVIDPFGIIEDQEGVTVIRVGRK